MILTIAPFSLAFSQQSFRNTISGFVFDTQRKPVSQIPVELTNEVGQILSRTKTNGSGRFFFSGLSSGRFNIRVLPYGTDLEEQSGDVEIINFVRGGTSTSDSAQRDFYLQERKKGNGIRAVKGTLFVQEVPAEAEQLYKKALTEFDSKRPDTGMELLLKAVKVFPEYYVALERLGKEFIKLRKYDYSRAAFLKSVSVNERSFNGWYGLSYSAYVLKEPETGVPAARKAIELDPSSVDAHLMLGLGQRQAKDLKEAEKGLLQAKKLANGQSPDVHWNLALLYANDLGRFLEAANELELYLKISKDEANKENVKKMIADFRLKAKI